jgi:hypothetical protein
MYKSQSGKECSFQQYIVEMMCIRNAKTKNEKLEPGFWNKDSWRKFYKLQIIKANSLKKAFSEQAILSALNSKKGEKIWSLYWRDLPELIIVEEERLESLKTRFDSVKEEIVTKEDIKHISNLEKTKQIPKKTNIDKLRELDE